MNQKADHSPVRSQIIQLSKQGNQLLKIRNYPEARRIFEEALHLAPRDVYLMTGLADTLRQQKEFTTASDYYRQVLEIDPHNPFALRGLGDALRGLQLYEDAIGFWKKYLQQKSWRDVFVLTRIADSYKTLAHYEESQTYYQKALAIDPHDRYALMGLADLFHKRGLEVPAIEYYEKALANGVTLIKILTIVGTLHHRQGNYEKARVYFEKTLAQDPDNSYALYGMGSYYRWKNDYQRAVETWERILEKSAGTVNLMTRLGDAYRNLGRYEDAERAYRTNLEQAYDKFSLIGMIKLLALQSRLQEACQRYEELLQREGEDLKLYADVADLLLQNNKRDPALQFLRHVRELQKQNPEASCSIENRIRQLESA